MNLHLADWETSAIKWIMLVLQDEGHTKDSALEILAEIANQRNWVQWRKEKLEKCEELCEFQHKLEILGIEHPFDWKKSEWMEAGWYNERLNYTKLVIECKCSGKCQHCLGTHVRLKDSTHQKLFEKGIKDALRAWPGMPNGFKQFGYLNEKESEKQQVYRNGVEAFRGLNMIERRVVRNSVNGR